jgi:NAD(P)-dependent dehydrogenase (short-subunit alcohol dehydrogenase family)
MGLTDKVVLVTGAGSGMGRAMVEEFAGEGARVAAVDIDSEKAKATVASLDEPSRALAFQADVADPDSVARCIEAVLGWGGQVDVLCNNAGVLDSYRPAHEVSVEEWNRVVGVNMTGPFLMARAVIPDMLTRSAGVIINTASVSAFSAAGGGTAYTASKHGVLGLTRQLTFDYGRHGIRVNAICPGATLTGMTTSGNGSETVPDVAAELERTPAGRWCDPREIARLAVYLSGDDAAFIHGSAVVIDGGWLTAARNPF